jgi:nitrate/nitrite transporter NarK
VIYNPLGAWLHDKVNSRRGMYITGFVGIIITTSILAAMTAEYAGTTNRGGNAVGILMIYLYLAFQGYVATPVSNAIPTNTFLIQPQHVLRHDHVSLRV